MKELFRRELHGPEELEQLASDLWALRSGRTMWLMEGEVGSGKTETVKALSRFLGLQEVASPSFAIHHRYQMTETFSVDHLDLYRLESEDDLESTGFWDLFSEDEGLIIIEWADRIDPSAFPRHWKAFHMKYKILGPTSRRVIVSERSA